MAMHVAVQNSTFRRVRSDDYISIAEQQTKETTAAVLVEILQDQTKKQNTHHKHQTQASTLPCDVRPRSLGAEVEVSASCAGMRQSRKHGDKSTLDANAIEAEVSLAHWVSFLEVATLAIRSQRADGH